MRAHPGSSWEQRAPAWSCSMVLPATTLSEPRDVLALDRPCAFSRQLLLAKLRGIWLEFKAKVLLAIHWSGCFHWQRTIGNESSSQ